MHCPTTVITAVVFPYNTKTVNFFSFKEINNITITINRHPEVTKEAK